MTLKRLCVLLGILSFSVVSARTAITATSQDLDEFSFGKGLKNKTIYYFCKNKEIKEMI